MFGIRDEADAMNKTNPFGEVSGSHSIFLPASTDAQLIGKRKTQRNVLVIEDNVEDFDIISRSLSKAVDIDYRVRRAANLSQALEQLTDGGNEMVLLNLELPDSQGLETFQKIRSHAPNLPIVILTRSDDLSTTVEAMKQGADDYFVKENPDDESLLRSVHYARGRHRSLGKLNSALRSAQSAEENLRSVINHSLDGIVVVNDQGIVLFSNTAAQDILGRTKDELHRNLVGLRLRKTTFDLVFNQKNGRQLTAEIRTVRTKWEGAGAYLVLLHDLTDRKKAEQESAQLAAIVKFSKDAIVSLSLDGIILSWNRAAEMMYGYSADDVLGSHFFIYARSSDRDELREFIQKVKWGENVSECEEYETIGICKDGQQIDVSITASPIRDTQGDIVSIAGIIRDITEPKKAIEQLRSSEERFRSVAESANDAIILANGMARISLWNRAAQTIFGFSKEEVLGKPLSMLMPPHDRESHEKGFERFAQDGDSRVTGQTVRLDGVRKDGSEFPMELSISTWKTAEGRSYCGIIRDITERKQAEQALRQVKDQLEERVRLRTESLAKAISDLKAEMARRKKYEEQARQHLETLAHFGRIHAMGEMASGLAHELNQPLAAIAGHSEICAQFIRRGADASSEALLKSLAQITEQAQRAGAINHMLRDFARKREFQRATVDINELVQQVAILMEFDTRQHDVFVRLELGRHIPEVLADRIQIEQVLVNLIRNAIEAMLESDDGRTLTIRTSVDPSANVTVAVIDSGKGFSPDEAAQVFDSFYTTKPHGMGLGLAICRTLIEAHGGRIKATANSDRGATFYCTLPVHNNEPTHAT
jgi:two-component system sensor kinase FixL